MPSDPAARDASPDPADKALIDRTRQPELGAMDKVALRDLIRDLRARRDAMPHDDKQARRPIVAALRRAVDERKSRDDGSADANTPQVTSDGQSAAETRAPAVDEKQAARAARQRERASARDAAKAERNGVAGGGQVDAAKAARKAQKLRPE